MDKECTICKGELTQMQVDNRFYICKECGEYHLKDENGKLKPTDCEVTADDKTID